MITHSFFRILKWLAHPRLVFWLLPYLMLMLVGGTLVQPQIGLYAAEEQYFASWLIWLGPVPLPGIYPVLGLLSLGLLAKLLLGSGSAKSAGNQIAHVGALLLMIGGMLTAVSSQEGFIALAAGEETAAVRDYVQRELVVLKDGEPIFTRAFDALEEGQRLSDAAMNFTVTPQMLCANCLPEMLAAEDESRRGLAQQMRLTRQPEQLEPEANFSGGEIEINGAGAAEDGRYALFEPMPQMAVFEQGEHAYQIIIRKEERALPFTVALQRFEKEIYPGTDKASDYLSELRIREPGGLEWPAVIRMNEPLRVMGYTLYQSSFVEREGRTESVLAVVKNHGRVFPYLASITIALGLLLHLFLRGRKRA